METDFKGFHTEILAEMVRYKNLLNRYEVMGCFGQAGLQRKNLPTAISRQLFGVFFQLFGGKKEF